MLLPESPSTPFKQPHLTWAAEALELRSKTPFSATADPFLCQTDTTQPSASRMSCTLLRAFICFGLFIHIPSPPSASRMSSTLQRLLFASGFLFTCSYQNPFNPFKGTTLELGCLSFRIEVQNTLFCHSRPTFCVKLTLPSPQPPE